jgi:hypothetical protein
MEYKTIREWFELLPDNGLRKMAMDRTNDHKLRMRVGDMGTISFGRVFTSVQSLVFMRLSMLPHQRH